jgi:hypothetical protein
MNSLISKFLMPISILGIISVSYGQESTNTKSSFGAHWRPGFAPTKAYQREVFRLMVAEVNRMAGDLKLMEDLPITKSNVVGVMIAPPAAFINASMLGNIDTSNYGYFFTVGRTISGVDQKHLAETWREIKRKYTWPISRLDTNAALRSAAQIMAAAGMDVDGLNLDCKIDIRASMTEGEHGKHFVPDYWVVWRRFGTNTSFLEFLEPTKMVRQFHVYDARYVLRKPVDIPNLNDLLKQTNDVPTNPFVPDRREIPP